MTIKPWLTAINRKKESLPLRYILKNNLIPEDAVILDYGCGYGFDMYFLKKQNFNICGYDKYIKPFTKTEMKENSFDTIISTYMFNVIPSINERKEALINMDKLLKESGSIFITVRNKKEFKRNKSSSHIEYKDGVTTKKGTFQKYYDAQEMTDFITDTCPDFNISILKDSDFLLIKLTKKGH